MIIKLIIAMILPSKRIVTQRIKVTLEIKNQSSPRTHINGEGGGWV